ncbi:unnamed protein product [Eruca vesicaria subsp. sativa]|uniref:S-protein homolog n=1 Tax=Eruca vesicaria subsp. sativa TaxID=29727 RepID=A0ABC8KWZ4_ERUVS|nr:unnamed protein product [Eruca vesicaria subsp. sativa]
MNPKTIVTNLLLLLLQISNFSTVVFSFQQVYRKPYKSEFSIRPSTVTSIIVVNELYGVKKGNAGFVCAHGPKVWRKSKPGDRYVVIEFKDTGITRYKFLHCHLRSSLGYVNVPISIHPDTSAMCYPTYTCHYIIREDGVYYKPEKKLFPWLPFPRSKSGRHPKA